MSSEETAMGLDTSHGCWHGAYSSFMRWRMELAKEVGVSDIFEMQGYGGIKEWNDADALTILMNHSDCDGTIDNKDCLPIAVRLEELAPKLSPWARERAEDFARGLRRAHESGEDVDFH